MDEATIREMIRKYIAVELIRDESYQIEDEEGIITGGLMDSFSLAELAVYCEEAFGVYIPDPDLTVEKMGRLTLMVNLRD